MPSANQVTLCGHLTRDPELRFTTKGLAVCSFGLAVLQKFGENEKTSFFDVKCWRGTAEVAGAELRKGSAAVVLGTLDTESWKDKETGNPRSKIVVTANVVASPLYKTKEGATRGARGPTPEGPKAESKPEPETGDEGAF